MATTQFQPTNFDSESLSQAKMQQLNSNVQHLYDNMTRMRYSASGVTKDGAQKVIAGKVPFSKSGTNWSHTQVNFGNYFSVGCKPVINATLEVTQNNGHRMRVTLISKSGGGEIDHTGFVISISTESYPQINMPGFVHYTAIGW